MKMLIMLFVLFWMCVECRHPHPLDPPTPSEFNLVRTIVLKAHPTTSHNNLTFQYVGLEKPDKSTIITCLLISSSSNNNTIPPPPLQFYVIVRFQKQSIEMIVDLATRSILGGTKVYKGYGYPMLTFHEQTIASLPFTYAPFHESLRKRGLNISQVVCTDLSVGWFCEAESDTKRILKIKCFYTNGTANLYARPVEGITAVVDIDELKIVDYSIRFVVPIPKAKGTEYRASKQKPPFGPKLKGISVNQRPGFNIDGHTPIP